MPPNLLLFAIGRNQDPVVGKVAVREDGTHILIAKFRMKDRG